MDQTLLVAEQLDIGMRFLEVVEKHLKVAAAVWVLRQDPPKWWLYIVTPELELEHLRNVSLKLAEAQMEFRNPWIDSCHLDLVGLDDPVAAESIKVKDHYPAEKVIPYRVPYFGKMGVENVYIYGNAGMPHHITAS